MKIMRILLIATLGCMQLPTLFSAPSATDILAKLSARVDELSLRATEAEKSAKELTGENETLHAKIIELEQKLADAQSGTPSSFGRRDSSRTTMTRRPSAEPTGIPEEAIAVSPTPQAELETIVLTKKQQNNPNDTIQEQTSLLNKAAKKGTLLRAKDLARCIRIVDAVIQYAGLTVKTLGTGTQKNVYDFLKALNTHQNLLTEPDVKPAKDALFNLIAKQMTKKIQDEGTKVKTFSEKENKEIQEWFNVEIPQKEK